MNKLLNFLPSNLSISEAIIEIPGANLVGLFPSALLYKHRQLNSAKFD